MDEKKVVEVLEREIKKLEKKALTSSDPFIHALLAAFTDQRVRDLFKQKEKEGYRFRAIRLLTSGWSIPEHKRIFVEFDCGDDTFCLVPPSFLVIVNCMEDTCSVLEIVDHFTPRPGETFLTAFGDGTTQWAQLSSPYAATYSRSLLDIPAGYARLQEISRFRQELPINYSNIPVPTGYVGMPMNVPFQGMSHPLYGMSTPWQTLSQPLPGMSVPFQQMSAPISGYSTPYAGLGTGTGYREMQMGFGRQNEVDRLWTPEARILPLTPGTVRLTAAIAVPNSCYVEGRAQIGVPQDHQILPEQIGVILPIEYSDQPFCMQYIKHLAYDVTFDINEAKTGVVIFSVLGNRVVGYAYCDLPQFIRMQQQQRQQLLTR